MTPEKCREVLDFYRKNLAKLFEEVGSFPENEIAEIKPKKAEEDVRIEIYDDIDGFGYEEEKDIFAHLLYMLNEMGKFIDEGRTEKFHRWLGFIQGVCWVLGYQNLEELKNLNKPEPDDGEATVGDPLTAEIAI